MVNSISKRGDKMRGLATQGNRPFMGDIHPTPNQEPAPMEAISASEDLYLRIKKLRGQMKKQKQRLSELVEDGHDLEKETSRLVEDMAIIDRELD